MDMVLHHQKHRLLSGGKTVYIGEDGRPYTGDGIIVVADGLGGRGGFPHSKIDNAILDREQFYDKVFGTVFGPTDDDFKNYVLDSFDELFSLKDIYFSSTLTMRTSGYFASRLVSAIVLYNLKFDPFFDKNQLFERLAQMEENVKKEFTNAYAQELARRVSGILRIIAENIGLEMESKTKGSYLLPSTLVVALTNEHEEEVEVIYLWAGDSRGYVWNKDGLAQVTDDHERDETMTNLITLTRPFTFETRYLKFKKPCLVFNTTDGIYKCPVFASPLDLECVLLQAIDEADGFEKASKLLDKQFTQIGVHDDSNTMGLIAFGYPDYDAVKADVKARLEHINTDIVAKLPDILERDYTAELEETEEQMTRVVCSVKDKIALTDAIRAYVRGYLTATNYAPFGKERAALGEKLKALAQKQSEQRVNIRKWTEFYWLRDAMLRQHSPVAETFLDKKNPYKVCGERLEELNASRRKYTEDCTRLLTEYDEAAKKLQELKGYMGDIAQVSSGKEHEALAALIKKLRETLLALEMLTNARSKTLLNYKIANKEMGELIERYVKADKEKIDEFAASVGNGKFALANITMSDRCRSAINGHLAALREASVERRNTEAALNTLADKFVEEVWDAKMQDIVTKIWAEKPEILPEDLGTQIAQNLAELKKQHEKLTEGISVRNGLYEEYYRNYVRYFEESKL